MPNHIHGIITINRRDAIYRVRADRCVRTGGATRSHNPMGTGSLGEIVRWFKGRSTYKIRKSLRTTKSNADAINGVPTPGVVWQSRFYEHVVRDGDDLNRIREYIRANPQNWQEDEYYLRLCGFDKNASSWY
ncbi:transposase [Patescibacteria group bacterium]|nr:transposase [Patescibacteria group bacterium]